PPLAEATILLAGDYPAPPAARELPLRGERPSKWTPERLYRDGMFHGPAFRGVVSMERWGEDGAEASLVALDPSGHFRGRPSPRYATDPVLLDQPGQVVGLWTAEHLERGYVVFPFRLEKLDLYGPPPPAGTAFTCRARIALQGESQVRSDLDVAGPDGRLHARLTGWWDRRFDLPRPFARLLLSPEGGSVGEPWPPEAGGIFATDDYRGCLVDSSSLPGELFTAHDGFWAEVLARVVLSRAERERWRALKLPAPRRLEWLLGRVAAKEAARRLLEDRWGLRPPPAEIEIRKDPEGRPFLQGRWISRVDAPLTLSLSHSGGLAVAVAGIAAGREAPVASAHGIGVDVETIGRTNGEFAGAAFSPEEQSLFADLGEREREEWALRCWCAKEAVAKALGSGFMGNPRNLVAQRLDRATGGVLVGMAPKMAEAFPDLRGAVIAAATWRDRNRIYGASTCRRSA
ncbi:MAG TPA: 4'-phosphopantetheinyl transferase superfamily protein, partial [Candidatus Saccharimonadales bacterium]|nr:4'-phosphopantetheinyl transferase superfamily protein [Candidatus Saccharimonadales bacterium]